MQLHNLIEMWEIQNPGKGFFDDCVINAAVNRDSLFDYLMLEFSTLNTIDTSWNTFHKRVINFFEIHKWNIDKLAESLNFDYNPIENYRITYRLDRNTDRGENVSTVENSRSHDDITDRGGSKTEWKENGGENGQDVNLVSAFNDNESPTGGGIDDDGNILPVWKDTEHHRDIHSSKYNKAGDNDSYYVSDTDKDNTFQRGVDTGEAENIKVGEDKTTFGNSGNTSYQELIEQERKQAEYNIYKWIGRHFVKELLIAMY